MSGPSLLPPKEAMADMIVCIRITYQRVPGAFACHLKNKCLAHFPFSSIQNASRLCCIGVVDKLYIISASKR